MRRLTLALGIVVIASLGTGCVETRGSAWMKTPLLPEEERLQEEGPTSTAPPPAHRPESRTIAEPERPERPSEQLNPRAPRIKSTGRSIGVFHNTYYSFPDEKDYSGTTTSLYDAQCKPIATVPKDFHDRLCVQGSGRLATRRTVSFAKRDCECAAVCPRSGQRICFEALDPKRFPWGRGAMSQPITPFRTVAVDPKVIPLGTSLFIPQYVGLRMPGGGSHDGCFKAEDRGLKVVGKRVDVFAGSESMFRAWNQAVPTATGVEIFTGDKRCR